MSAPWNGFCGNGYILTLGGKQVYISGDTKAIPEMKALKNIDIAFICMNLPYTMTPQEAADAVRSFRPKVVYPYHYRGSDTKAFADALKGEKGIEVRLRDAYWQLRFAVVRSPLHPVEAGSCLA